MNSKCGVQSKRRCESHEGVDIAHSGLVHEGADTAHSGLVHEGADTAHSGLVHEGADTNCWTQNGDTHGHISATFKRRLLTYRTEQLSEKLPSILLFSLFFIPFLSLGHVMLLLFFPIPFKTKTCQSLSLDMC